MSATLDRPTFVNAPDEPRPQPHRPTTEAVLTAGQAAWVARARAKHPVHAVPQQGFDRQVFVYRFLGPLVFRDLLDADGEVLDSASFRAGPGDRERARQLRAEQAIGTADGNPAV